MWKPPTRAHPGGWINTLWAISQMEYYSAVKKHRALGKQHGAASLIFPFEKVATNKRVQEQTQLVWSDKSQGGWGVDEEEPQGWVLEGSECPMLCSGQRSHRCAWIQFHQTLTFFTASKVYFNFKIKM